MHVGNGVSNAREDALLWSVVRAGIFAQKKAREDMAEADLKRLFRQNRVKTQRTNGYATIEDFRRIFLEGTDELYQFSFLLTANHGKAEKCFLADWKNPLKRAGFFREWARSSK